jgi:hypothetical protein
MPPEDPLRLHEQDGLAPCWQQGGGEEKSKSISRTHAQCGRATTEDTKLVAKGGILEDELTPGAAAEVSGDSEWLRGGWKRGEPGPNAAGESEDARGDGGDCHGGGSTTKEVAAPAP